MVGPSSNDSKYLADSGLSYREDVNELKFSKIVLFLFQYNLFRCNLTHIRHYRVVQVNMNINYVVVSVVVLFFLIKTTTCVLFQII